MSRSKHTDPRDIRSARRVEAPRAGRGAGDLSGRRRSGQVRKQAGIAAHEPDGTAAQERERLASGIPERLASGIPERLASGIPERLASGIPERLASGIPERLASGIPERLASGIPERLASGIPEREPPARPRLRIVVRPPRRGFHHPAGKQDVAAMLQAVGPAPCYGLCSVELGRSPAEGDAPPLVFGRYHAPGRIVLVEQPLPPGGCRRS